MRRDWEEKMEYYATIDNMKNRNHYQKPSSRPQENYDKKAAMYYDLYESIHFFEELFLEALGKKKNPEHLDEKCF